MKPFVAVGALALLLAACGGGHPSGAAGPTSSSTPPPAATGPLRSTVTAPTSSAGPTGGPVPSGFEPTSVSFVSAAEGFVLGTTASCAQAPCTSVLRTTDAGAHWVGIPAPREQLGSAKQPGLSALRFADARNGFAYGSLGETGDGFHGLYATHDGGSSWHGLDVPEVDDLIATDGVVFAVALGASDQAELLRADAESDSFTRVPGLNSDGGMLTAAGADVLLADAADHEVTVVAPSGSTLQRFGDPGPGGCAYAASSVADYLAVCGSERSRSRHVYGTTDGGARWTALPDPGEGTGYTTLQIAVTTARHAVIETGGQGQDELLGSADGGEHWAVVLRAQQGGQLTDPGFTTATEGVVVSRGPVDTDSGPAELSTGSRLELTHDGGQHWAPTAF